MWWNNYHDTICLRCMTNRNMQSHFKQDIVQHLVIQVKIRTAVGIQYFRVCSLSSIASINKTQPRKVFFLKQLENGRECLFLNKCFNTGVHVRRYQNNSPRKNPLIPGDIFPPLLCSPLTNFSILKNSWFISLLWCWNLFRFEWPAYKLVSRSLQIVFSWNRNLKVSSKCRLIVVVGTYLLGFL
jgi:hypothetical protein